MWVNHVTGETSEVDPTSASTDRSSSATVAANSDLVSGTFHYNTRRKNLAERGIYEWEAALDNNTGKVYYANNVNFSTTKVMPACMDRLGELSNMVTLKLSQNKLRSLPGSICSCHNLEILEANANSIENLPPKIGDMKRLRCLRLDFNCLTGLPGSIAKLEQLEELVLTNNFFAAFPEYVMKSSSLKKLLLGNNQIKKLPYSVGFLSNLDTLELYNNPLVDPPAKLLLLGMDALLWECRRRHWARVRGLPPVVRVHGFGIEEERLELQPEFDRRLAGCIEAAGRTGELNFMMEGLTYFPMGIFQEEIGKKLKALRLDSNDLSSAAVVFRHWWEDLDKIIRSVSLCNLLVLSLKNCKLQRLDNSIAELVYLKELYLENNRIMQLPETVRNLQMLQILDVKNNRLQDCPENIGYLSRLKRLELDGNRLETLPQSLSQLRQLQVLTLSSNHVYQFPEGILALEQLKTLDANRNALRSLPSGFGMLRLRSLKLSYNRLENLRHEVFRPLLKNTLQQLWLSHNNLLQLPDSLTELSKPKEVKMDSNPFKSPPLEILGEGFPTVVQYLRVRMKRIAVMHYLILERGFDTSLDFLQPEVCGVLRGNTGYLSPEDLDEVDKTVDSFLNGNFYRQPLSAEAILDAALELRDARAREFYDLMVRHLYERALFHETRDDFSENVFCRNMSRPWGRNREPVGCFAIALSAVFDDAAPNVFLKEFREALWTEAKRTLPKSVFEYSCSSLRKALTSVKSAYGPVARFEDVMFDSCECVDPITSQPIGHPKGECRVPGLVMVKIMYTPEEAQRRNEEDREVFEAFTKRRRQVSEWLEMKPGKSMAKRELLRRKAAIQLRVGTIKNTVKTLKETLELKVGMLALAQKRKVDFDKGGSFTFHNLASAEQATALVEAAQKEVDDIESEVKALIREKDNLKADQREKVQVRMEKVETSLQDKYCYLEYAEIIRRNRMIALKRGWRRPWDGIDGQDFIEWAKTIGCIAAASHERPENVVDYAHMEEPTNTRDEGETLANLNARFNWEGADNTGEFLVPRLVEWKEKRAAKLLDGLDPDDDIGYDDETMGTDLCDNEAGGGSQGAVGGLKGRKKGGR